MIDPQILLDTKPPVIQTALDAQRQAQENQNLANVGQIQRGTIALQPGAQTLQQGDIQTQAMAIQQQQRDMADQQIFRQAYIKANGDPAQTMTLATQGGASQKALMGFQAQVTDRQTKLATAKKDQLEAHGLQTGQLYDLFSPIAQIADPVKQSAEWTNAQQTAVNGGLLDADEVAKHPYPGPEGVPLYVAHFNNEKAITAAAAKQTAQSKADTETDRKTKADQTSVANAYGQVQNADDLNATNVRLMGQGVPANLLTTKYDPAEVKRVAESTLTAENRAANTLRAQELAKISSPAQLALLAAKGDPDAKAAMALIQNQSIAERKASQQTTNVNITPEGQQVLNENFATKGQLVSIPRGPGAQIAANTINAVGKANSGNFNPAVASANFKADSSSLTKLQGQSDALDAYGAKFIGNLDQFSAIAKEVPKTFSPYLNTPLRMLNEKLLGEDVYGRLNVARTVAANEGGRILSGGGNLGGVVSDNARHEIGELLDKDATLGQWVAAADQLHKDYAITQKAMRDQLTTIKGRIAAGGGQGAPAVPPHVQSLREKYGYHPAGN